MSSDQPRKSIYQAYGKGGLEWARLELEEKRFLSDADLALVLEVNAGEALPGWLNTYLIGRLRGEVSRPRGPVSRIHDPAFQARLTFARVLYRHAHRVARFLAANRQRIAESRREILPKGEAPPQEIALRFVLERGGLFEQGSMTPESLANLLSREKKRRR